MNITVREGIATFVAAAVVLLAVAFYRRAAEAERNAEETKTDLSRKIKDLQGRVNLAAEVPAAARVEEERPLASVAEKPEENKAAEEPPVPAPTANMTIEVKSLMNSTTMKQARRRAARAAVEEKYGDLLTSWGLQGDARQKMMEALIARDLEKSNGMIDLMHSGLPGEEIQAKTLELQQQADDTLAQKLTSAEQAALKEYEASLPDRMMQKETEREVADLGIDSARAAGLRDILVAEKRRESEESTRGVQVAAAGAPEQRDATTVIESLVKSKRAANERILSQARPILTDAEYENLKEQRAASIAPLEFALRAAAASKESAQAN